MLTKDERQQAIKFQDAIGAIVDQYLKEGMDVDRVREILVDEASLKGNPMEKDAYTGPEFEYPDDDLEPEDDYDAGEECGRWDQNARGGMHPVGLCRLAGTEFCDWECPYSR